MALALFLLSLIELKLALLLAGQFAPPSRRLYLYQIHAVSYNNSELFTQLDGVI